MSINLSISILTPYNRGNLNDVCFLISLSVFIHKFLKHNLLKLSVKEIICYMLYVISYRQLTIILENLEK